MSEIVAISTSSGRTQKIKTWQMFVILCLLSTLISFLFQKLILTENLFYSLYSSQMEDYRIDQIFNFINRIQAWGYFLAPLIIYLRLMFMSLAIQLPLLIQYVDIPFRTIFRIVTVAFFAVIASDLARFIYLYSLPMNKINRETLSFIPLSLSSFLNASSYSQAAYSFLSKINIFEFLWPIWSSQGPDILTGMVRAQFAVPEPLLFG